MRAHSVTHIGLNSSLYKYAYPSDTSRQLCLHVCCYPEGLPSLFTVKADEQINTPTQALLQPARGMRYLLSMIFSAPFREHKLAGKVHGWLQVGQARMKAKFKTTCIDVSLLSSRRPGSADEPHRTLFSIVAENLSLAASTAGDPSSCTQLNVRSCSSSAPIGFCSSHRMLQGIIRIGMQASNDAGITVAQLLTFVDRSRTVGPLSVTLTETVRTGSMVKPRNRKPPT